MLNPCVALQLIHLTGTRVAPKLPHLAHGAGSELAAVLIVLVDGGEVEGCLCGRGIRAPKEQRGRGDGTCHMMPADFLNVGMRWCFCGRWKCVSVCDA